MKHLFLKGGGAKALLYTIAAIGEGEDHGPYDYDTLLKLIQEEPELLLTAERICFLPPLGFAMKTTDGLVVDYLKANEVKVEEYVQADNKALSFDNDAVTYTSIVLGEQKTLTITELMEMPELIPVYQLEFHSQAVEQLQKTMQQQPQQGMIMVVKLIEDLYFFNPKISDAPFCFAAGSEIPMAMMSMEGSTTMTAPHHDMKAKMEFYNLISNNGKTKQPGAGAGDNKRSAVAS